MAAYITIIEVCQGADKTVQFGYFSPDPSGYGNVAAAVPYNLTNYHLRMQVRYALDPNAQLLDSFNDTNLGGLSFASVTSNPGAPQPSAPNGFAFSISKAKTIAYPAGTYYFDVFGDNIAAGTSQVLASGTFVVVPTVTRL